MKRLDTTLRIAAIVGTFFIVALLVSSDLFSATRINLLIYPLFGGRLGLDWRDYIRVDYGLRKVAHFVLYAAVAIAARRAVLRSLSVTRRRADWIALVIAILTAAVDEIRQSTVPTRGSSLIDFAIDVCGAITALLAIQVSYYMHKKHGRRALND